MGKKVVLLIMLVAALSPLGAADQVTLANGDRISGTLLDSNTERLRMRTEYMAEVEIRWEAVQGLVSEQPLFVTSADGQVLVGPVTTSDGQWSVITGEAGSLPVSRTAITSIRSRRAQRAHQAEIERLRNPGLLDFWRGQLDAGLSLSRGNAETTTINTSTRTERKTQRDKISIYATSLFARDRTEGESRTTANAIRGGTRYDVNLNPSLFTFGFIDLESDPFQDLDFRNVLGGGMGWHVRDSERLVFDIFGGGSFNQEFFENDVTRRSGELLIGEELVFQILEGTVFTHRLAFYPNLNEGGDFRLQFDSSLTTQLNGWLGWNITLSDRFLSDPVAGVQKNDILLSTGARFTFGRRR